MYKQLKFVPILISMLIFDGCSFNQWMTDKYNYDTYLTTKTLNGSIKRIADQLQDSANNYINEGTTTITSFVDANLLERTNLVGRTISESLFSELFKRGFDITDFRGKDTISVGKSGEFFITRDASRLKSRTANTFVLTGTYSIVESQIYISARIMDNKNGKIVAAARVLYTNEDCSIIYLCQQKETKQARLQAQEDAKVRMKLKISRDVRKEIIPIRMEAVNNNINKLQANTTLKINSPASANKNNLLMRDRVVNELDNEVKLDAN